MRSYVRYGLNGLGIFSLSIIALATILTTLIIIINIRNVVNQGPATLGIAAAQVVAAAVVTQHLFRLLWRKSSTTTFSPLTIVALIFPVLMVAAIVAGADVPYVDSPAYSALALVYYMASWTGVAIAVSYLVYAPVSMGRRFKNMGRNRYAD